jgi:hypothetical protein
MDIKQHNQAKAMITVGKDTTFRDFAQGAYRMRAFAKGLPQTLEICLVPEVLGLIRKEVGQEALGKEPAMHEQSMVQLNQMALDAVAAWLLLNQIRLESKQMLQLCVQNIDGVTRRTALARLLALKKSSEGRAALALTEAFTEDVNVCIPTTVPIAKTFVATLQDRVQENATVVSVDDAGSACIKVMLQLAKDQTERKNTQHEQEAGARAWARKDLDAAQTRTQEKEQQLEQEKQKQREIEREASPWKATTRDNEAPVVWHLNDLLDKDQPSAFYNVSRFKLRSRPGEDLGQGEATGDLLVDVKKRAPTVYLSENFASSKFTSPRARRLRSLYTVLQWKNKKGTKQHGLDRTAALSLLEAATVRRAGGESAKYPEHLRLTVLPKSSILVGADVDLSFFNSATEIVVARQRKSARRKKHHDKYNGSPQDEYQGERKTSDAPNLLAVRATASLLSAQSNPGVQLLRYFDCQVSYSEAEGSSLLSTLASVAPTKRQQFFTSTIMSKRRDQNKWAGTTLAPYMQLNSYNDLMNVRQLKQSILHVMEKRGLNPTDLSRLIDADKNLSLSIDEIVAYLSTGEMQKAEGMPSRKKLAALKGPLLLVADKLMDGRISYEEFEEFLLSE